MKKIFISMLLLTAIFLFANTQQDHTQIQNDHDHQHSSPTEQAEEDHDHETPEIDHDHSHETDQTADHDHATHEHGSVIANPETIKIKPATYIHTIQTTGMIRVTPGDETMIVAKTDGIIHYTRNNLVKGKRVTKGTQLFSISGSDLIGNNLDVRFLTAKNELQRSREAFQRAKSLIKEKIISRQEFLTRKSQFVSDSLEYRILKNNYYSETLSINAPITGELYDLFVKNGDYVSAGQKLAIISGNHHLYLAVDLPKQYYAKIHHINSGNFKMEYSHKLHRFTSEAKLSDGSRLKPGSPFLPINFSLSHTHNLIPGSFAQVWLNIGKTNDAIVVPKSALMEQQGVYFVFIKLGPEDYLKTPVKIASMNAYEAQIATGLHVGDEVVVSGVLELKLSQSSGAVDPHAGHNH